ncbi:MAG: ABC transporter permease [Herbinix sp.]|nr:ABC transporter permease [Herbinix sp.]
MKNSNIAGWKDVFSFTFIQTMKSKTFIISYVILILIVAVSMPVISLINSGGKEDANAPSPIQKVYVNNQTTLGDIDFSEVLKENAFRHISFEIMQEDYDTVSNRIEESEQTSVLLTIAQTDGMYSLDLVKASKGPVKDNSIALLGDAVATQFEKYKINTLGITQEQAAILYAPVDTKVSMLDVSGAPIVKEDTSISGSEYGFIYGLLFVVMMVNIMASTQIATSIVTEKSTRVIEYLLTSVKPLALIIGKVIAMLTAVLLQIVSLVAVAFISNKVSAAISGGNGKDVITTYLPANIFHSLNIVNIIFCILLILLGMIFYATLAGLAGATVSRLEELQEGLQLFMFANVGGAYIGIAAANILMASGNNAFVTFAFLFPLSSPFILPGAILVGKVSIPLVAASLALLLIFIVLLFKFVAKIFETLILHNGNKIKIKELIKLSKTV